jgi:hypothetical protein
MRNGKNPKPMCNNLFIKKIRQHTFYSNTFHLSAARVSRLIKRLRVHGPVKKKAPDSYKYYLTKPDKQAIIMA